MLLLPGDGSVSSGPFQLAKLFFRLSHIGFFTMRLLLFFKIFDYTDITFILLLKILNITNKAKVSFDYHPNSSFLCFCVCLFCFVCII